MKQAYYHVCRECSKEKRVCAKCGKSAEVIERYATFSCDSVMPLCAGEGENGERLIKVPNFGRSHLPAAEERVKEEAEVTLRLGALRERDRRRCDQVRMSCVNTSV